LNIKKATLTRCILIQSGWQDLDNPKKTLVQMENERSRRSHILFPCTYKSCAFDVPENKK
jgi:hypothetical protein